MDYSADLEGEVPSINTLLYVEIKTTELLPLQVEGRTTAALPFLFRLKGNKEKKQEKKSCKLLQ